jgi:uncharacterized protein (DUF362 family)
MEAGMSAGSEIKARVSIANIRKDLSGAVGRVMDENGVSEIIKSKPREVFVKVNAIDSKPYCYTSVDVAGAVLDYCRRAGAQKLYLMENATQGNFTRLVFHAVGFNKIARDNGARCLYLDEDRQVPVTLPHMGYEVRVSRHVRHIIDDRDRVTYINVPKLKLHSMAVLTCGIKNQYGLIMHKDRASDHNWNLHRKLADIYSVIQPDFTMVDGKVGTIYGHYPPVALQKQSLVPFNILVGGTDTLAVDTVCARIFGYSVDEVGHLAEARDMGLGCADLDEIDVVGEPLERFKEKYPYQLYDAFPPDVEVIRGSERNCLEGCDANTMAGLQNFYLDYAGKGGFTIVMGKGFDREKIDSITGKVYIAGGCAYDEVYETLAARLGKRNVHSTTECNDLAGSIGSLSRLMKVSTLKLVPLNPVTPLRLLAAAKLHRSTARVAPVRF